MQDLGLFSGLRASPSLLMECLPDSGQEIVPKRGSNHANIQLQTAKCKVLSHHTYSTTSFFLVGKTHPKPPLLASHISYSITLDLRGETKVQSLNVSHDSAKKCASK